MFNMSIELGERLSPSEKHEHLEQYDPCKHPHLEYCKYCREFYCLDCHVVSQEAAIAVSDRLQDAFSKNFRSLYDYLGEGLIGKDYRFEIN